MVFWWFYVVSGVVASCEVIGGVVGYDFLTSQPKHQQKTKKIEKGENEKESGFSNAVHRCFKLHAGKNGKNKEGFWRCRAWSLPMVFVVVFGIVDSVKTRKLVVFGWLFEIKKWSAEVVGYRLERERNVWVRFMFSTRFHGKSKSFCCQEMEVGEI